jgi:hypothetical protein
MTPVSHNQNPMIYMMMVKKQCNLKLVRVGENTVDFDISIWKKGTAKQKSTHVKCARKNLVTVIIPGYSEQPPTGYHLANS